MSETAEAQSGAGQLARTLTWKQGLIVAMGVPILIMPSIADMSIPLWGMSIAVWVISVISGFFINLPIGELCATFGVAGMGGSIQYVFEDDEKYKNKKINTGRLIGALGAWSYFVAWFTVIPIFTIMVGYYLIDAFDLQLEGWMETGFYLLLGVAVYSYTIGTSLKGLEGGAKFQMILTLFTIIPLVVIVCAPFVMGDFHMDVIIDKFTPTDWVWDGNAFLLILSLLTIAQWSAVGWETAATYGAEYKEPAKDVPKALIMCGIACLVLYFLISFAVYGTLGPEGIEAAGATSLAVIAENSFGETVGLIATLLLMVGMIVIVQTSMQGCSRTIQVMASNGHMPLWLSKTNKYGVPVNALLFQAGAGFLVILSGLTASETLAISCPGYVITHGLCQLAFIKSRKDPRFKDVERIYKCPKGFVGISTGIVILEFFLFLPSLFWYLYTYSGVAYCVIAAFSILIYVPIWYGIQKWNHEKHPDIPNGVNWDN
ncbi:MAG: APC family permease [Thermoplasmata archaeon]|jgi:amino acid transporter|nr:APC family permease [Thermoplasmata archaeon]